MFSFNKKNEPKKPILPKKIPILIVNKDWHSLFPNKKPSQIKKTEKKLEDLVKKYSSTRDELKDYEKLKKQLMEGIIADMDNITEDTTKIVDKKMNTNSDLIHELNQRMEKSESQLDDLPAKIEQCNKDLIFQTAEIIYQQLIENTEKYHQYVDEINQLKIQLRKKLEYKVDLEEKNDFLYHKLHQVLGAEVINQLDEYFIGSQGNHKSYDLKGNQYNDNTTSLIQSDNEDK